MIIDHLGRIGGDGMIRDADVQSLCALAAHPKVFIKDDRDWLLFRTAEQTLFRAKGS